MYDTKGQKIIALEVDLGIPFSLASENSQIIKSPNVIPLNIISIPD